MILIALSEQIRSNRRTIATADVTASKLLWNEPVPGYLSEQFDCVVAADWFTSDFTWLNVCY